MCIRSATGSGLTTSSLNEEGRTPVISDICAALAEEGYAGQELTHGMCNNEYTVRPRHLAGILPPDQLDGPGNVPGDLAPGI